MKKNQVLAVVATVVASVSFLPSAFAQDPDTCRSVRFAETGSVDIASTNALAQTVMKGLGYQSKNTMVSIPMSFAGVSNKSLDVSLGHWWPIQEQQIKPFVEAKSINILQPPNLTGAQYTFAVPSYVYESGLHNFSDIEKHRDKLDGKIYAIEPGTSANTKIKKMIDENKFGLGGFKLIESSEAGMLVAVKRAIREKRWVVFLGWEPHPMNLEIEMNYLAGGDEIFGPNYGEARVYTITNPDFLSRCPNAAKFIGNLRFTTEIENKLMQAIKRREKPLEAANAYLKSNPEILNAWLSGVTTFDGKEGLPAVRKSLGLQ